MAAGTEMLTASRSLGLGLGIALTWLRRKRRTSRVGLTEGCGLGLCRPSQQSGRQQGVAEETGRGQHVIRSLADHDNKAAFRRKRDVRL